MKRNKFLALLLVFVAAGYVACTNDDPTIGPENNPLRESMTVFRSGKNGYGDQGSGNTESNAGGTGDHYCGVVQGTANDIQLEWYGIKGCAGYRVKAIIQGRDFEKPADCLVDTILPPNVLSLRIEDLQYKTGFRFAIQTLSTRGEAYNSKWFGYGDGAHPGDYLQLETGERYAVPEVFWVENVTKESFRLCWNLKEDTKLDSRDKFETENGEYVVDQITVEPSYDNPDAGKFTFNFADYKDQGYIDVTGLTANCVYVVNGLNNNVVRYWDRLYNTTMVRMKGDAIDPVLLKWEEWYDANDLNTRAHELQAARIDTMLTNYMTNSEYPEGTIFELEPRKVYYCQNTVNISKGFTLRCSDPNVAPEDRPLVYLGIGWMKSIDNPDPVAALTTPTLTVGVSKADADTGKGYPEPCSCNISFSRNANLGEMGGINVQAITFENINFDCDGAYNYLDRPSQVGSGLGNYFINQSSQAMAFTLAEFNLRNCNFRRMIRGFIRFQGPNRKQIEHFKIDNCMWYDCGCYDNNGRGYSFVVGDGTIPLHNLFKDFSLKNSTLVDYPIHALLSENKNTAWADAVSWNVEVSNNTFVNFSTRSKDRLLFEMRYNPNKCHFICKNNLFLAVRNGDKNADKRTLYVAGMRAENNTGKTAEFQDNYTARCDVGGKPNATTDWGQKMTDGFITYNFSHATRGVGGKGVNVPTNGGDAAAEAKLKWFMKDDGTTSYEPNELFEDPSPKSSNGALDMHWNYKRHGVSQSNAHVTHYIPDGFYVKSEHKSKFYTDSGEPIGDPRWLTK